MDPYLSKRLQLFKAVFLSVSEECVRNCIKVSQGRGFEDKAEPGGSEGHRSLSEVSLVNPEVSLQSLGFIGTCLTWASPPQPVLLSLARPSHKGLTVLSTCSCILKTRN